MKVKLLNNEIFKDRKVEKSEEKMSEDKISEKYEEGHNRIVTEQGSYKLPLLKTIFKDQNYILKPDFQRRVNWDVKKKSKLIESFIINIPIPPVFIYEKEFDCYEVMDGLQRISSIIGFYNDGYALEGLEQWSELNGMLYSQLPQKIREGIDRRQLSSVTLLKESAQSLEKAEEMKKMVFERLNTGGVKLEAQEIRNAIYNGPFNALCRKLSEDKNFKKLWDIAISTTKDNDEDCEERIEEEIEIDDMTLRNDKLYKRMYDVELVLRFFSMRHVERWQGQLSDFLDNQLISGNTYSKELLEQLELLFIKTMECCYKMFGEKSFCQFKTESKSVWSKPQRMIYDPMCLVISQKINEIESITIDIEKSNEFLSEFYEENSESFNGKKQSKSDILSRVDLFEKLVEDILKKTNEK